MIKSTYNTTKSSAIILAAGFSERIGSPKAFLKFDDQRTFLEKIIDEYKALGIKNIVTVLNNEGIKFAGKNSIISLQKLKIVINHHPEYERLYSIKLGIDAIGNADACFIQNVDNPFVDHEILKQMMDIKDTADYIVPVYKGKGGHPVLINKNIIDHILSIQGLDQNLRELLSHFQRGIVESENERIFYNINTHGDYQRFLFKSRDAETQRFIGRKALWHKGTKN